MAFPRSNLDIGSKLELGTVASGVEFVVVGPLRVGVV